MSFIMPQKSIVTAQGIKSIGEKREFKFSAEPEWKEKTLNEVGNLDDLDLYYGRCLVAKYIRTTIGTMGLVAAEQTRLEDKFQGKVGLLLKKGPLAFRSTPGRDFGGADPEIGQWVYYHSSDGYDTDLICVDGLTRCPCRVLQDAELIGVARWPGRLW